jgi:hypothetical protein
MFNEADWKLAFMLKEGLKDCYKDHEDFDFFRTWLSIAKYDEDNKKLTEIFRSGIFSRYELSDLYLFCNDEAKYQISENGKWQGRYDPEVNPDTNLGCPLVENFFIRWGYDIKAVTRDKAGDYLVPKEVLSEMTVRDLYAFLDFDLIVTVVMEIDQKPLEIDQQQLFKEREVPRNICLSQSLLQKTLNLRKNL